MSKHVQKISHYIDEVNQALSFADDFTRALQETANNNWDLKSHEASHFAHLLEDKGLISSMREKDPEPGIAICFGAIVLQARLADHKLMQAPWDEKLQKSSRSMWELVESNSRAYGFILPHTRH